MNLAWVPVLLLPLQIYVDVSTSIFQYHRLPWNFPTFWLKHWVPYVLLTLMQLPGLRFQKLFSWKLWIWPSTGFVALALSFSAGPNRINLDFGVWQFRFQWMGIATWMGLFAVQLFLYQRKVGAVQAFAASYFGVLLASTFYEMPVLTDDLQAFLTPKFLLSVVGMILFLFLYCDRMKMSNKILFLSLAPIMLNYIFFLELPFWLPRLSVFPFFLLLPISICDV